MNIKKQIKKVLPISYIYNREYRRLAERANKTYTEVEKELNERFEKKFDRKINWSNPTTYNEKLQVVKLYGATPLKTRLTDKLSVIDWVKKQLGEGECGFIPLLATYDSVDEIDFSILPEKYVMKMNNDSGSVFIHDKNHPVTKELIASYRYYYQKRNFAYYSYEMHYKNIKPKIMIEQYMGDSIRDYKFQCFDGKPVYCQVDFNRFGRNHVRNLYDRNWKLLPYNKGDFINTAKPINEPSNYTKMWKLATKLSKGFDQVRVDFYDIDNRIYFGEMTFTSASGTSPYTEEGVDEQIGNLWHLDMNKIRKHRQELLSSGARIGD